MIFSVIGAGSWGTALAMQMARNGITYLWGRNPKHLQDMQDSRSNEAYLPGIKFPDNLIIEDDLETAIKASDAILVVSPSHAFAEILQRIKPHIGNRPLAWASKGFEPGSGRFLHEVAQDIIGKDRPTALVTGPSFAKDVAEGKPTLVAVASTNKDFAHDVAHALHNDKFRVYISDDLIGAELGGAVKNVLALATGICDGMQLGDNTRAAILTRGMAEMMRLGKAMNCKTETLMGLSGLGDLVLTCTGDLSRNRRMGLALGAGQSIAAAKAEIGQVVEGIGTADEVMRLAKKYKVDMPISEHVWKVVNGKMSPAQAVKELMSRGPRQEFD
ncbi:Glycerol-3-phosphate dehydrogenase [NAD(P)+] [hydrothermal vent metagenome]|uniref:Glycerol-3-phosphate dehydrogenase [NAD(P)+] n=1 Tax=hydrothermal vent metagenome TaxID=652676 RepID=A0A3B0UQV3_9ZZZZ